ncbi:MAG: haloacid dehalogenase type II [Acidimicrobiia bacterium]
MAGVLVFDVNETLLDLRALDPLFQRMFGNPGVRRQWFGLVLRNALSLTIIGEHQDFVSVGTASLQMVAEQHQVSLTADDVAAIAAAMTSLPAHDDVAPNLDRLASAGFRMAALTNSPQEAAESQLASASIAGYFEDIMSVTPTAKFKPAPEVYILAATKLGVEPSAMTMVAAHDWDVAGAMSVGCRGAYIMRPGMVRNPLYPQPDITGPDFERVTNLLLEQA